MEFKQFIRPLLKWWWLAAIATLVAGVTSYVVVREQPRIYRARATVMIGNAMQNPNPTGSDFYMTEALANTYADVALRDTVRGAVADTLGLKVLPAYTTRVVPNTQLLEITVTDTSPARAQAVANGVAEQLTRLSPSDPTRKDQGLQTFVNDQLSELAANIKATQAEISKKQEDLGRLYSAREIANTQSDIAGLQNKLNTLQNNFSSLYRGTAQGAVNAVNLVESASLPVAPIGPNRTSTVLLAMLTGFLIAAGAAYLLDYLDDSLKNHDDVKAVTGLTTLGAVPEIKGLNPAELIMLDPADSPATEAYRVLRTNLQFTAVDRPLKTVLVSSPSPAEGKSFTAANLAAAFAQAGQRVILVDADLHRPRLHRLLKLHNNVGLTTALLERDPSAEVHVQATTLPGLYALTSGPLPPNAAELLGSARMGDLLAKLRDQADLVVLDSPPVAALSDAAMLSTKCDGVLLVMDAGRTRRDAAKRTVEALRQVNAHLVGVLLNRMPAKGQDYYYYYHYGYDYGSSTSGNGHRGPGRSGSAKWRKGRGTPEKVQAAESLPQE